MIDYENIHYMNIHRCVTAYIFEDVGGFYVCDADGPLYTDGKAYKTKADAMRGASREGYVYAEGSGTYWNGRRKIPKIYKGEKK